MDDAGEVVRVAAVVPRAQALHVIVANGGAAAARQDLLRCTREGLRKLIEGQHRPIQTLEGMPGFGATHEREKDVAQAYTGKH